MGEWTVLQIFLACLASVVAVILGVVGCVNRLNNWSKKHLTKDEHKSYCERVEAQTEKRFVAMEVTVEKSFGRIEQVLELQNKDMKQDRHEKSQQLQQITNDVAVMKASAVAHLTEAVRNKKSTLGQ